MAKAAKPQQESEFIELHFRIKFKRNPSVLGPSGTRHDMGIKCLTCAEPDPGVLSIEPIEPDKLSAKALKEQIRQRVRVRSLLSVATAFADSDLEDALAAKGGKKPA